MGGPNGTWLGRYAMGREQKSRHVTDECFASLVRLYLASTKFNSYSAGTQETWGRELNFAARPNCLGMVPLSELRPALLQAYLDGLAGRPGKQAVARSILVQLEKWAMVRDLLPRSMMTGV